ncbi:G-type lectin S-receptor-like serine/threonine-protein kinase At2g19130 [Cryptomeria japonica]|uniref:G-type lectin S-receptor-like serine/threonine-protein kinase At2g19130 n=1 Tax=Cryptomeria japonica TaxID=3369 RepID=UPI0027DA6F6C|nr:G-type lectin S-receptor-like serine/threonine-protein kinase At2g19130 [Cryptomeria japonica]
MSLKTNNIEMGSNGALPYMLFVLILLIISDKCTVDGGDTLSLGASLRGNQTVTSKNGTFELGFFSPNGTNNWYIGIWYGKVPEKTIVWVANRERPAKKRPGVLKLSTQGTLDLFDAEGASLWSVNVSNKASRAVILDSGNFVVLSNDNKSELSWQSFDHPVDTWLPGMKMGGKKKLVCWNNSLDPAPGHFSHQADPSGIRQFVLKWDNSVQYWESGVWNGKIFSQIPEMALLGLYNFSVEDTSSGFYLSYTLAPANRNNALSRFIIHTSGEYQQYVLLDNNEWSMFWSQPRDQCNVYNACGAYGICNSNNIQFCSCMEGFIPRDNRSWSLQDWSSTGCVRLSPLNCDAKNGRSTDGFIYSTATLPDKPHFSEYPATTKNDCEKACLHNCSCTAFAFNPPSGPCQIWSGDLPTMHNSPSQGNSNVFIRVAASTVSKSDPSSLSKRKTKIIVGAVLAGIAVFALGILSFLMGQRYRLRLMERTSADSSNSFLRAFSYKELKIATRNFSDKLGNGGFGSVFKGSLIDGTLVAVKRLEGSRKGEKQFRAEINSLGNIQHKNLVRLLGFSVEGSERLLVYEYMPNGSLNFLLFSGNSESKRKELDWKTRFEIALGIAKGLLYLHEECRECIIHNDVKPENILLDNEFTPKLADFGLAKLLCRDSSHVLTTVRGTRGYLAPEWFFGLPITPKVDVYSFGMTLLEIISGRRNVDMRVEDSNKHYFPSWVAAQVYQGNMSNIVEEVVAVAEEADTEEMKRGIVVGLLCIEKDENVRPSMGQVVRMLEGKMDPPICQIPSDNDVITCTNVSGDAI